ncbi:hypothetical protein LguiA_020968 [Lonicera macranthoides]
MEVLKKLKDGGEVEEKDKHVVIFGDLNDNDTSKEDPNCLDSSIWNDISLLEEIDFTAIQLEATSKVLYPDVDEQAMKIEPHSQIQMKSDDLNLDGDEGKNLIDGEPNNPSCGDQSFNNRYNCLRRFKTVTKAPRILVTFCQIWCSVSSDNSISLSTILSFSTKTLTLEIKHHNRAMKRKKWSELEEQTLLTKYSDLLNFGTPAKLKTREKKFKPIADHVNSIHHLQDPINFLFRWSWRDVSIKVQNMRHQYLGVKQKIYKSKKEVGVLEREKRRRETELHKKNIRNGVGKEGIR